MPALIYAIGVAVGLIVLLSCFVGSRPRRTGTRFHAKLEALEAENDEMQLSIDSLRAELLAARSAIAAHTETQDKKYQHAQSNLESLGSALAAMKNELTQKIAAQEKRFAVHLQELDGLLRNFVARVDRRTTDIQTFAPLARAMLQERVQGAILYPHSGEHVAGERLMRVIEDALAVAGIIKNLSRVVPPDLLEQAAIAGVLDPKLLRRHDQASDAAVYVAHRLDTMSAGPRRGWIGEATAEGLKFSREADGGQETQTLDRVLMGSSEAETLDRMAGNLQAVYLKPAHFVWNGMTFEVRTPSELLKVLLEGGDRACLAANSDTHIADVAA